MPVQKERRAAPRKAAAPMPSKLDKPVTKTMTPPAEDVRRRIEMTAYFKAKARGFQPGYELEDWLEAEREVRAK